MSNDRDSSIGIGTSRLVATRLCFLSALCALVCLASVTMSSRDEGSSREMFLFLFYAGFLAGQRGDDVEKRFWYSVVVGDVTG